MTKQEYTIIRKFIRRVKKDLATEIRNAEAGATCDDFPLAGAAKYARAYLTIYESIIKDDLRRTP